MFMNDTSLFTMCERGLVTPFDPDNPRIDGPTVDLTLSNKFFDRAEGEWKDSQGVKTRKFAPLPTLGNPLVYSVEKEPGFFFQKHCPWLCVTQEQVHMPMRCLGILSGRTTWAREFLQVVYAGFVQPGHANVLVLEIKYDGEKDGLWVPIGAPIVQMAVAQLISNNAQAYRPNSEMNVPYPDGDQPPTTALSQDGSVATEERMLRDFVREIHQSPESPPQGKE